MNGRASKALRRDIRRAVGPEAVSVIESHTAALDNFVAPNLKAANDRIAALDTRILTLEAAIADIRRGLRTVGR